MQILMEVLDSNQFLPWGATKKRQLNCAVVFASNRSWEALRELINFDEHSRLGATVVEVISLRKREEDLIAVLASTLAEIGKRFSTWPAPVGLTNRAWQVIRECQWRGNIRTLTRCIETASVKWATSLDRKELIEETHIREAILQWEPSGEDQKANMYL
jgi:DNA-binding NtrC family response regulator